MPKLTDAEIAQCYLVDRKCLRVMQDKRVCLRSVRMMTDDAETMTYLLCLRHGQVKFEDTCPSAHRRSTN